MSILLGLIQRRVFLCTERAKLGDREEETKEKKDMKVKKNELGEQVGGEESWTLDKSMNMLGMKYI